MSRRSFSKKQDFILRRESQTSLRLAATRQWCNASFPASPLWHLTSFCSPLYFFLSPLSTKREEINYLFIIWCGRLNIKRGQMTLNYLAKPLRASSIITASLKVRVELRLPVGWRMAFGKAGRETRHSKSKTVAIRTLVRIGESVNVWISKFTFMNGFGV